MDRLQREQQFHDRQAAERAAVFAGNPTSLAFTDEAYLDHETWIRPAFQQLGDVRGKRVLDLGCGHGMAAVVLARRGAHVTALDLSAGYVNEAQARACLNGVTIDCVQADGERLPFADGSFEAVWGCAILHHLDIRRAAGELYRVLKPGAVAVLCEPWGQNPVLRWARRSLLYPGKQRTRDEQPLQPADVRQLRAIFPAVSFGGFQLLGMARRLLGTSRLSAGLDWCDRRLLTRLPRLQHFCRYVVVCLRR